MTGEELKQDLLNLIRETHSALLTTIDKTDLEIIIHKDSGWRAREMLSHIGAWDRELVHTLREFNEGNEYLTPDFDEDAFNGQAALAQKNMSTGEIVEDWKDAREELFKALEMIPAEKFPGELLFPWGDERGSIYELIKYFCDHDLEHKEEIENFMKGL